MKKRLSEVVVGDEVWDGPRGWQTVAQVGAVYRIDGGPFPHDRRMIRFAGGGGLDAWDMELVTVADAPNINIGDVLAELYGGVSDGELRDLDDARRDGHEAKVGP